LYINKRKSMATEIKMPQLSDTMSSGKILSWKKKEGDQVSRGDILAEVETDKANLEIESFFNGTLLKILTPAHSTAGVGEVIAVIGAAGESTSAGTAPKASAPAAAPAPKAAAPAPTPSAPTPPAPTPPPASAPLSVVAGSERVKASPLAKRVAEQLQVNLSSVQGSGPNGRIIRRDVEAAAGGSAAPEYHQAPAPQYHAAPAPMAAPAEATQPGAGTYTALSKMRETIARRMQESVNTSPHFYCTSSINMGEALRLREVLKELPEYKGISVNHLVIKAAAYALKREPKVNAAMKNGQLYQPAQINIGIITAIPDGLLIPVLKEVDSMALKDVVFEARAAIERARAGRPSSTDLSGGTFSISNMGMFDVENFTAIINPGQGGILAVSAVQKQPIVQNGQIVVGSIMKVTVSVDHRIIDGVMSATFLKHFKDALETPALLMA
jgi:pyruvate dehydrogenase E2 component (dihydrolipoamide acetyltransferase)